MDRRGLGAGALVTAGAVALILLALSMTVKDPGSGPGDRGGTGGGDIGGDATSPASSGSGDGAGSGGGGGGGNASSQSDGREVAPPTPSDADAANAGAAPGDRPGGTSGGGTPQSPPLDPKLLLVLLVIIILIVAIVLLARSRAKGGASALGDGVPIEPGSPGDAQGSALRPDGPDARDVIVAYGAACAQLAAAGHTRERWETAGEFARRSPAASREAMTQLTRLYESVRHGNASAGPAASARARMLLDEVTRTTTAEVAPVGEPR